METKTIQKTVEVPHSLFMPTTPHLGRGKILIEIFVLFLSDTYINKPHYRLYITEQMIMIMHWKVSS